jgi:protein-S-isoprenylcysteine O-methyltransferase Ste14
MKRSLVLLYATSVYAMFLGTFLYLCGFVGGFAVPKTIDGPDAGLPLGQALLINGALVALFALQHTIMARPTFKRWWAKWVRGPAERATYVLLSNVALILLFVLWQPMTGVVWEAQGELARGILWGLFGAGWLLVLIATFQINHFDLFGLRQAWTYFRGRELEPLAFKSPFLYRQVRHPIYLGWITAFLAVPTMTVGHLLFGLLMASSILVSIRFEERNLTQIFGKLYADYRRRVPMLVPRLVRRDEGRWR